MGKLRFPFCCASPDSGRWGFKRHRCKICKKSRREVLGGPCVKKKKRNDSTELRAEIWAEVGKERKKSDLGKSELRDCSGTTWRLRCLLRPHPHGERELKLLPPLFPQLGWLNTETRWAEVFRWPSSEAGSNYVAGLPPLFARFSWKRRGNLIRCLGQIGKQRLLGYFLPRNRLRSNRSN